MITHAVVSRRKEIAVRMALGARPRDVQRTVVGTHLVAGLLGLAAGAALALRGTVLLQQVSADVRPDDPMLFLQAAVVLAIVMFLASSLPARRAARIDPAITLKAE
jgi:putative ABC transport system permease protein